ncbi:MAG: AhpC/TSA family protein [Chitinophagaceae bacterium]|nr:AhpC/TSA family protein [Chitinophagaceae bacterium]
MKNQIRTKYFIISIVLLISLVACNSKIYKNTTSTSTSAIDNTLKQFSIKGDVSKVKDPIDKIVIMYKSEGENFTDTTDVKNGSYKFSGKIRDARTAYLIAININKNIESKYKYTIVDRIMLFIEPTKMKATSSNSFSNLNLTGSPSNIDYQKWISASIPSKANMDEKAGVWFALGDTWMKSKSKEDSLRFKNYTGSRDANIKHVEFGLQYAREHINSPVIMQVLIDIPIKFVQGAMPRIAYQVDEIFNQTPLTLQNTELGEQLARQLAVRLGNQARNFSLPDMHGNTVNLSSTLGQGKYVLLEFWASWCAPCRAESPHLVKAFSTYKNDFTIFSVSRDRQKDEQKWLDAIGKDGTNLWPQVLDQNNKAANLYGVENIPANFLLDREGKIIAKDLRGPKLEEKLKELIDSKN